MLRDSLGELLGDLPRRGAPRRIGEVERDRIVGMACNPPADHGVVASAWSLSLLAEQSGDPTAEGMAMYRRPAQR